MKKSTTVYWLVPAEPQRELFREIISILAKQFDGPRFEPHLTLFVIAENRQSPAKVLRSIKAKPIRLRIRGVDFSAKFTKTLFVRFNSNTALEKLAGDLRRMTKSRGIPARDPHLSLLYKEIPAAVKKELAATIGFPFKEVAFDSIRAVRCQLPVQDRAGVEAWRVMANTSLVR